jgi:hypothetical protein
MKTLTKEHGLLSVNKTGPEWELDPVLSQGWSKVSSGGFVSSKYFDLAGMSMEDKTLFFEAAGTQELLNPQLFNVAVGDSVILCDIMTSSPMTDREAVFFVLYGNFAGSETQLSFDETIYARCHAYSIHVDTGAYAGTTLNSDNQLGSMKPTASDRVYSYRVALLATVSADRMDLSGCRHILRAVAKEESDHEYMMRLMRSYQLQQEPDVD